MMEQTPEAIDFQRAQIILGKYCDDPSWLIRLWKNVKCFGQGQPDIENTVGHWDQGLEEYVN